jgi:hypothetical protein
MRAPGLQVCKEHYLEVYERKGPQRMAEQSFLYKSSTRLKFAALIALGLTVVLTTRISAPALQVVAAGSIPEAYVIDTLNTLPLFFISNIGQTDPSVKFTVQSLGGTLFFKPDELVLSLANPKPQLEMSDRLSSHPVLRVQFEGANPNSQISGGEKLAGIANYFIGNDPDQWRTNIDIYADVSYANLYPGIDLHYEGHQGVLKSTYIIAPGVDPTQIGWRYRGADNVRIEADTGDLLVTVSFAETGSTYTLRKQAPVAWQDIENQRVPVDVSYILDAEGKVGFSLGVYDPGYPLIIDPVILAYSTYIGGNDYDWAEAITVDDDGNVYIAGFTVSNDFPTKNAYDNSLATCGGDVFVTRLDTTQSYTSSLVYSTYLGGSGNCANDGGLGIAVDSAGNAYVTGFTQANDFPVMNAYDTSKGNGPSGDDTSNDAFVTKLDATGSSLLYSTYLGGNGGLDDVGHGITADNQGNAYVAGFTRSDDFPTKNAYQDSNNGGSSAFVTKLDTTQSGNASLLYSTYLGGTGNDMATDIAMDSAGNAYLSGHTNSIDFPTRNAYQNSYGGDSGDILDWGGDYFVTKLDTTKSGDVSLVYSSYLGGSENEGSSVDPYTGGIAVDSKGSIYVTGETKSSDFPMKNAYQDSYGGGDFDAFVAKLDPTQSGYASLIYSTYLGGTNRDIGYEIAVNNPGNAFVTGYTQSSDFPTKDAYQDNYGGESEELSVAGGDAFVTKLSITGNSLLYSTYLGGSGSDRASGIAVDSIGNVYVTGETYSDNFPVHNAYDDDFNAGIGGDGFVTKLVTTSSSIYLPIILKNGL